MVQGFICILVAVVVIASCLVFGVTTVITTSIETGGAIITNWTTQHQATERTRIQADADKKTSGWFSLFWLTRFMLWLSAGLIGLSFILKRREQGYEQRNSALLGTDRRGTSAIVVGGLGKRHPDWR
jgi:hypothetical protein